MPHRSNARRLTHPGQGVDKVFRTHCQSVVDLVPKDDPHAICRWDPARQVVPMGLRRLLDPSHINHVVDMPDGVYVAFPDFKRDMKGVICVGFHEDSYIWRIKAGGCCPYRHRPSVSSVRHGRLSRRRSVAFPAASSVGSPNSCWKTTERRLPDCPAPSALRMRSSIGPSPSS